MKFTVFVFAKLKPSQINYKIIPLSESKYVEKVYILRKTPLILDHAKIECLCLPLLFRLRPFYWIFTAIYGTCLIKRLNANLILSYNIMPHGFNGYVASALTSLPFLYAEIIEDTIRFYQQRFKKPLIQQILKKATKILVPGSKTGNFWESQGFNKTYQLHSTVDPKFFKPDSEIKKAFDFIYVGLFDKRKRPELIINCLNEIKKGGNPDIRLCMIGYGELKNEIKKQIAHLGLEKNIELIETQNVLEYYQKSKILVMASLAEGIPCAMMEAMACELIVVVPPVGDIADVIIHQENGFLHNNTQDDLLDKMKLAFWGYNKFDMLRQSARATIIRKHSYQFAIQRWNELLKN